MEEAGGYGSSAVQEEAGRGSAEPESGSQSARLAARLVYQVIDQEVVVFVVAVDRRERDQVYRKAAERLE